ncbi:GTP-binding protein of the rab [Bulinus truncatus]|nr:GTP-binding protein of the rab [Bulinus truncatus]
MNCKDNTRECFSFKVILIGQLGVGKTSFFLRLRDNRFYGEKTSTIGIDSCSKVLKVDGKEIKLLLLDTAGVERFQTLTRNYYRGSHAVLFLYSVDDPLTLTQLQIWHQEVCKYAPTALRYLVGNKSDLDTTPSLHLVEHCARCLGCEYVFSVSAKTGQGFLDLLNLVCKSLVSSKYQTVYEESNSWTEHSIHVNNGSVGKQSPCCS